MKTLIVANWKCNPTTLKGAKLLFNSVQKGIKNIKNAEIVICPPFIYLPILSSVISHQSSVKLGAQDCFWEEKGAFTGEVSPKMLKDLGCQYVIIGHSERRRYFKETDEMINKKIKAALEVKLKPILCIGETEAERKKGETFKVLKKQVSTAFKNISSIINHQSSVIIAYEPIWAIGTGNPCLPPEAKKVLLFLRKSLRKTSILYGGSVNSENARDYLKKAGFQGLLVGGASLNAQEFIKIVKNVKGG
jgi:triosephosphate isomerase